MAIGSAAGPAAFEVRTAGAATNGGGFITGASGTDMSVFDNKNSSGGTNCQSTTDNLSTTDAVANGTTTITSATANFTSALVGNIIYLTGGSGPLAATHRQVTAFTNSTTITVDASVATGTGITMNIGGAKATVVDVTSTNASFASGIQITYWLKSGTYTLTTSWTLTITASGTPTVYIRGYHSTRGDHDGTRPLITSATNSVDLIKINLGTSVMATDNVNFSHTAATRAIGIVSAANAPAIYVFNSQFDGCSWGINADNVGARFTAAGVRLQNVEIKNSTSGGCVATSGITTPIYVIDSYIHDNTGYGLSTVSGGPIYMINTILYNNTTYGVGPTGNLQQIFALNCSIVANGTDGIQVTPTLATGSSWIPIYVQNTILYGNGGWGINSANTPTVYTFDHNAYGSNTSGNLNNVLAGTGDVSLSGSPFTSSTNFALANNAAGNSLKQTGFPGAFPGGATTGYTSIGAADPIATSVPGTGGVLVNVGMTGGIRG